MPTSTRSPLARLRARRHNRGAAVFLVVLVIAMLGAMGVFASRAAGLTEAAAGFERSNVQTDMLVQHGMMLTAAEVGAQSDAILAVYQAILQGKPGFSQQCSSGKWFPPVLGYNYPCQQFDLSTLSMVGSTSPPVSPATVAMAGTTTNPANYNAGSLGQTPLSAFVNADLSDIGSYWRPVAGTNVSTFGAKFGYVMGTVGVVGRVSPLLVGTQNTCNLDDELSAMVASQLVGRGYVLIGPKQLN